MAVLDNPLWYALSGPQRIFAEGIDGAALRYDPEVSIFAAIPDRPTSDSWAALASVVGPGGVAGLARMKPLDLPPGWEAVWTGIGVQMVAEHVLPFTPTDEVVLLDVGDVPAMLDLVARTEPGPFLKRTIELGTYFGIRAEGALVAMAGQRMRLDGYVEISAVCTDPEYRGRGYAATLVRAVMADIAPALPILHARKDNVGAIRLYERLGFATRREFEFGGYQAAATR